MGRSLWDKPVAPTVRQTDRPKEGLQVKTRQAHSSSDITKAPVRGLNAARWRSQSQNKRSTLTGGDLLGRPQKLLNELRLIRQPPQPADGLSSSWRDAKIDERGETEALTLCFCRC